LQELLANLIHITEDHQSKKDDDTKQKTRPQLTVDGITG
jgi:hypothetical protein